MSAVDDDAPALVGAIIYHAEKVRESVDHLWRVLGEVAIRSSSKSVDLKFSITIFLLNKTQSITPG